MLLGGGIISPLKNMLSALLSVPGSPTSCLTSGRPCPLSRPYVLPGGDGCFLGLPSSDILWRQDAEDARSSWSVRGQRLWPLLKPSLAQVTSQVVN